MIGEHVVTLIPDPDAQSWGAVLNANPYMTDNLNGWSVAPFAGPPWTWDNGQAVGPAVGVGFGAYGLFLAPAPGLARSPGATQYRVRARVIVRAACWVIIGLHYGTTPANAHGGPFWAGDQAMEQVAWFNAPTAGAHTFEVVVNPGAVPAEFGWVAPLCQFFVPDNSIDAARVDSIELNGQGAEVVDLSCLVDQVTIRHGREDADAQPEAGTATLDLSLDTGEAALPDGLEVGSIVRINTVTELTNSPRFVGRVTDIGMGWDDAGEDTPNALVAQVMCAAPLSELGRRVVGDVPWPQELDGARVARIMANAGVTLDPTFSDPGTVQIIGRDVDAQAALPLAQEAAQSANGIVWETRGGEVRYADADHRRGATPALAMDACDVLVTPTWRRSTEGLINKVSIGYGVTPEGGEQPRYTADDPTSVERFGRHELSTATQLATLADATALGQMLLVRNSSPVWIMAALPVDVKSLDPEETAALLGLDMHSLVTLTGLPVAGSAPTSASLWVEGWQETLAAGIHDIELLVSGYCRTAPAPQWDDVNPVTVWDTVTGTWDDWTCIGPTPSAGRWSDVPASLRWDRVPQAIAWDTWPY